MSRTFLDTNILVYADQPTSAFHGTARETLLALEAADEELWISPQVIREYLSVVTRPDASRPEEAPLPPQAAVDAATHFLATFWLAGEDQDVSRRLLDLIARYGVRGRLVHDANIVATMLTHGIPRLLTFNARDFRRFGDLIEIMALGASENG